MEPRVARVKPNDDYTLTITFTNGEVRVFDVKPYLNNGSFSELKNIEYFKSAKAMYGGITWEHKQELFPEMLYEDSIPIEELV